MKIYLKVAPITTFVQTAGANVDGVDITCLVLGSGLGPVDYAKDDNPGNG